MTAELIVGSDGMIFGLRTEQTSYSERDKAVFEGVLRKWKFKPAYYHGRYVNAKVVVEIKTSKSELNIRFPESGCKAAPFAKPD